MIWRWGLGLALALSLAAPGGFAQESGDRRGRSKERRDEAYRMVDAYVIANIQESLGLDDDTYVKVIPLVNSLQKVRREYFRERSRGVRGLRRLLRSGSATEAQVEEALSALKRLEADGPERIRKQAEALDAVLSPLQQAKYRVFEVEVEQRMRELMRRGRGDRSPEEKKQQ